MPLTLYLVASLPVVLVALLAAAWWPVLQRPGLFFAAGVFSLYALLAVIAVAVVFVGPGVGSYFLETSKPSSVSPTPLPVVELLAIGTFIVLGAAILWAFKQWQLQP